MLRAISLNHSFETDKIGAVNGRLSETGLVSLPTAFGYIDHFKRFCEIRCGASTTGLSQKRQVVTERAMTNSASVKRIGILTGGGDCPGLNAVIRAVTKAAITSHDLEIFGIDDEIGSFGHGSAESTEVSFEQRFQ